jgi:hypothetical protein
MTQPEPSGSARWVPNTDAERKAVREQLHRLLGSPLLSQSRRYSTLLRYIVECSLEGGAERLKERTLGVEVFGRQPDYDPSADPVVRTTAAQLRRRIAQYYFGAGHENEIVIDLPPGGYTPEFHHPSPTSPLPAESLDTKLIEIMPSQPRQRHNTKRITLWSLAVLAVFAGLVIPLANRPAALDQFWAPVLNSPESILVCVGVPTPTPDDVARAKAEQEAGQTVTQYLHANSIAWPDAITFSSIISLIRSKNKSYHLQKSTLATLPDLRGAPSVLVGGYNNQWIMRLGGPLRFSYKRDDTGRAWIEDRQNPSQQSWTNNFRAPFAAMNQDFGMIARFFDPTIERQVVIVSGIAAYGTIAAGEFLTNEKYMRLVASQAPKGWERKNIQAVFSTRVINGNSGPPEILATHFW